MEDNDGKYALLRKPEFSFIFEATVQICNIRSNVGMFSVNINLVDYCKTYDYYIFGLNKDPDLLSTEQINSLKSKTDQFVLSRQNAPMKRVSKVQLTFNNLDNSIIENDPIRTSAYDETIGYLNIMDDYGNYANITSGSYYVYVYFVHFTSSVMTKKAQVDI